MISLSSNTEVYDSIWFVVDAILACPQLKIKFPSDHFEQRRIALQFEGKSKANFDCCVGAIDGMLLWTEKPMKREVEKAKVNGVLKFRCGRKHKYGLQLQGVCDAHKRFIDINIEHPASTGDYLAFMHSELRDKLESSTLVNGARVPFLATGLCLFGDNAYVNTSYMATPYSNVKGGSKDDYNFYHSNVSPVVSPVANSKVRKQTSLPTEISSVHAPTSPEFLLTTLYFRFPVTVGTGS